MFKFHTNAIYQLQEFDYLPNYIKYRSKSFYVGLRTFETNV